MNSLNCENGAPVSGLPFSQREGLNPSVFFFFHRLPNGRTSYPGKKVMNISSLNESLANVGSDHTYSVNRLVELLGGDATYVPKRPGEPDCTFADTAKIKRLLGWKAEVSLEDGVKVLLDNIDYWRDAPVWTPDSIKDTTKDWFRYLEK